MRICTLERDRARSGRAAMAGPRARAYHRLRLLVGAEVIEPGVIRQDGKGATLPIVGPDSTRRYGRPDPRDRGSTVVGGVLM